MPAKRLIQRNKPPQSGQATKKAVRGFKAAPPKLREIIELVDLVRPKDRLTPIDYRPPRLPAVGATPSEVTVYNEKTAEFVETMEKVLDELTKDLPVPFQEYVFQKERADRGMGWFLAEAVTRYENVRVWSESLRAIAQAGPTLLVKLNSALYIVRNPETGKKSIVPDRLRAALEQDGVDVDYIRECGVCGRIFYEDRLYYQGKITEPACQDHGQTLRSRRNYKPVKTDVVKAFLTDNPHWKRTEEAVRELSGWTGIDATTRQTNLALDFIEREKKRA